MQRVAARAPTRIDFGGGWTDVPPYSTREGGVVCNVAIDRRASVVLSSEPGNVGMPDEDGDGALGRAALARAALRGVRATMHSDFPRGAGLGGSSAAGVAMAGAIRAWRGCDLSDRAAIAEESRTVEVEDLRVAGGRQDHYAAVLGGALELTFGETTSARRIPLSESVTAALQQQCIIVYTGQSRISGGTIRGVLDGYTSGDRGIVEALARMKTLASEMSTALEAGDIEALGQLVGEHWRHQRSLHPGIPTPLIDEIIERAVMTGAHGGKALGASGGGCVLLIAPTEGTDRIRTAVAELGAVVPFALDHEGLVVEAS
jgi:D-glycero-alpha-D-manno-heptose-7-phosphate kinase